MCGKHAEQCSPFCVSQKWPGMHLHTVSFLLEHSCQVSRPMSAVRDKAMGAPARDLREHPSSSRPNVPGSDSAQLHLPEATYPPPAHSQEDQG